MDPISDILALLKPRSVLSAGLTAGGDWSIRFPAFEGIKFNAVMSGHCWLAIDGMAEAVSLQAGDCFMLPKGRPFRLASDLDLPALDAETVFAPARCGGLARVNGGRDFVLLGARFMLDGDHAGLLVGALPPLVHIGRATDQTMLRWLLDRMQQELRDPQPGGTIVVQYLAQMMFIQALRLYVAEGAAGTVGWLAALADRQMASAISLIHAEPAHGWTVAELARQVGMSRTAFAVKFKAMVGSSPIDYLTRWRMALAGESLSRGDETVATIAASLGYESESAFGTAFRRVFGYSPRQYRNRGGVASSAFDAADADAVVALPPQAATSRAAIGRR